MTRHLGVSVFLSVLIVIFFAVILYQPEGPPHSTRAAVAERSEPPVEAEPSSTVPASTSPLAAEAATAPESQPRVEETPHAPPVARTIPTSHRPAVAQAETAAKGTLSRPSKPASRAKRIARPLESAPTGRTSFIQASAGETLDDVALRVFGSPDAARALWMANRDILPDRDTRLSAGMVLRTP